ncbi:hypothetical protein LCGC14_0707410 [marine sediment metagenome]|uniref:Phospholipase C n=1 Tax=marine sediment metagenome TaxID=412755 RepID=A0A0F9QG21_9ZZZZ|nr:DNRLRE domain-containing protein [archaeon]
MRKRIIVPLIFICLLLIPCSQAKAWANDSYANNSSNYTYALNYATHDWIAQKALEILLANDYSKWEWLKDRELIYLTGTEAPDNANLNMTLDNEVILGYGDFSNHFLSFHENGTVKSNWDKAAIRAQDFFELAEKSLNENKLDQAAFYFGAMTHYISDSSVYAHVAQKNVPPYNVDFSQYHSTLESRVRYRTNDYYEREEFFLYTAQAVEKNSAYNITLEVGWDTYKDPNPSEATVRDAYWLHNNFFPNWILNYEDRLTEVNQTKILYYDRIEENLNKAIEGCVAAINYTGTAQTVHAMKDAHVYSRDPDTNYGDWDQMYLGNWNDGSQTYQDEVYITFNISSQPSNWKKIDLFLYVSEFPVAVPLDFKVFQITQSWNESVITWNNKPAHDTLLTTIIISKTEFNRIDVTSIISGDSFSISLDADVSQWETIRIHSTEAPSISLSPKLIFTYDEVPPKININSPSDNQLFGLKRPDCNITVNDPSLNSTWYTLDNGLNNFTFVETNNIINQSVWDNQPNGILTVRIYANDSSGNLGFSEVTIQKDTIAPILIINSPTLYQLYGVDPPTFDIQIQEPNLLEKGYSLNGGQNITFTSQTKFDQTEWNNIGNGTVVIKFYAKDIIGNINFSEVIVRKDAYIPDMIINSPFENETFGSVPPFFNISIISEDVVLSWYRLSDASRVNSSPIYINETNSFIDQEYWIGLTEGEITITFYIQDRAGNIGIKSVVVIKRVHSTPANEFSPALSAIIITSIVGGIGVSGAVLVKYRKKIPNLKKHFKTFIRKLKRI